MALQKTLWRPDTCGCEIEYQWDDSVPLDQRVHSVSKINKACPVHAHHGNKEAHYADILDENTSKNKAVGLLVKTFKKLDGGENEVTWRFNEDRSIVLSHPSLTAEEKVSANALPKTGIVKQVTIE